MRRDRQKEYTAYTQGILLDGSRDMVPQTGQVVIVRGGRIEAVQPEGELLPPGCEVVNLQGMYLMPGLINMHVHLNSGGKPSRRKKKPEDYVRLVRLATSTPVTRQLLRMRIRGLAAEQLQSGVTTIRTVGGIANFDSQVRDEAPRVPLRQSGAGSIVSDLVHSTGFKVPQVLVHSTGSMVPRILTSNTGISVPGGPVAGSLAYAARSAQEAAAYVDKIAQDEPDLIKLMITGGIMDAEKEGEPGVLKMPPEVIEAACSRAHELGFPVASHTESTEGVLAALRGGVDTIEHGAMPTQEMMDLFHSRGAALITTLSPVVPLARLSEEVTHVRPMDRANAEIVLQGIIGCAVRALEEDIPVGLGTDAGCPYVTQYDTWRELEYFHRLCGVTNTFALYTATLRNAQIAGIDGETGSIEAGKSADLLVTAGNPLEHLRALRKPAMVVLRGQRIVSPQAKHFGEIDRALDELCSSLAQMPAKA